MRFNFQQQRHFLGSNNLNSLAAASKFEENSMKLMPNNKSQLKVTHKIVFQEYCALNCHLNLKIMKSTMYVSFLTGHPAMLFFTKIEFKS